MLPFPFLSLLYWFGAAGAEREFFYDQEEELAPAFEVRKASIGIEAQAMKPRNVENYDFWRRQGDQDIRKALNEQVRNKKKAKNVIIFVGDGMSNPTVASARIFKARQEGEEFPERSHLIFEDFPNLGHSKTYDVHLQTPDSASTASALFSGIKTVTSTMGFDSSIVHYDATSQVEARRVETILTWSQEAGKSTGVVTTARVTHATPGATYAHIASRGWECGIPKTGKRIINYNPAARDIAWQLINSAPGNKTNVVLGGGRAAFKPEVPMGLGVLSVRYPDSMKYKELFEEKWNHWQCGRSDGLDLVEEWKHLHPGSTYVESRSDLMNFKAKNKDEFLFGLFTENHLPFQDQRIPEKYPSLAEMTQVAIETLRLNPEGFFLMVEGARIDHAHHGNEAIRALNETAAFDDAIRAALALVDTEETLIIVTADHAHSMLFAGATERGNSVTGLAGASRKDKQPLTVITYANGPGFGPYLAVNETNHVTREPMQNFLQELRPDTSFPATAAEWSSDHGGEDVAIYAVGPMAHLIHATHEQTHIANVMAYSACIGPYKEYDERCKTDEVDKKKDKHHISFFDNP